MFMGPFESLLGVGEEWEWDRIYIFGSHQLSSKTEELSWFI